MRKVLKTFLASVIAFSAFSPVVSAMVSAGAETATEKKSLNVYIIAGQSNAVGYSNVSSVSSENVKSEYNEGFENIYFYGCSEGRWETDLYETVKFGQGRATTEFGSEVGIADTVSAAYTDDSEALIIKYAYGGTYLTDNTTNTSFSQRWGNWCPPSMTRSNEVISAANAEEGTLGEKLSGRLYDKCIDTVTAAVEKYQEDGYSVSLKGTFWMQGEAECDGSWDDADYEGHLRALIADMREDYAEIFDATAKVAPFVLGKIAPTFNGGGAAVESVREIQEDVAATVGSVYCVETEDYIIVDPKTNTWVEGCKDRYHFNGNDMLSLGKAVGESILFGNTPRVQVIASAGGSANISFAELKGEPITITFTADERYRLEKVYKDGVDVTDKLSNGNYIVTETDGIHIVEATFVEDRYKITREYAGEQGRVVLNPHQSTYFVGDRVRVKVETYPGNVLKKVTFNGAEIQPETDGFYYIIVVQGENVIETEYEALGGSTDTSSSGNEGGEGGGTTFSCGSSIGLGMGISLVAMAFATFMKKRSN